MKYNLISILIIFLFLYSCTKENTNINIYKYEVFGTSGYYNICIIGVGDTLEYYDRVDSGWEYSWNQCGCRELYISAYNVNGYGDTYIRILRNDVIVKEKCKYGGYKTVTIGGMY